MNFFDDILDRLPSSNIDAPPAPCEDRPFLEHRSTTLVSNARTDVRRFDRNYEETSPDVNAVDEDLKYNFPTELNEKKIDQVLNDDLLDFDEFANNVDDAQTADTHSSLREINDVDVSNFAFFFNHRTDAPSPTTSPSESTSLSTATGRKTSDEEKFGDRLSDECFWKRPDDAVPHSGHLRQQVDRICTTFNIDKSSLDRFLPMYNVAVNISTRMQYDRFTFVLLFIPIDAESSSPTATSATSSSSYSSSSSSRFTPSSAASLRLFAIRTFLDHEAELVRDILSFVGQQLFSSLFGVKGDIGDEKVDDSNDGPRVPFSNTLSSEVSRIFLQSSAFDAGGNSNATRSSDRRLFLPSVFAYTINVDSFLDQLCTPDARMFDDSSLLDSEQFSAHTPAFVLLKKSRDKLLSLSRRILTDPSAVNDEVGVLKALSERLQSRKRKRPATSPVGRQQRSSFKSTKLESDNEVPTVPDATKRAIVEHINDESEYWSDKLKSANNRTSSFSTETRNAQENFIPSFAKFSEHMDDRSVFVNLDELCNSNDSVSSLADAHISFFQRYETVARSARTENRCLDLVEMTRSAFHAIDPLLFDHQRLGRDIARVDTVTSCFLAGLQIEYFAARNKLNDIHRHIYLRHVEITRPRSFDYNTELNFSKNFTTYFDFYEMVADSVEPLFENVPYITASRILIPLEWLPNKLVRQALRRWSSNHLDFDVIPSLYEDVLPPTTTSAYSLDTSVNAKKRKRTTNEEQFRSGTYDFKHFVVCNYARSPRYRHWSRYIRRVQRQAALLFDIDPLPPVRAASTSTASPSLVSSTKKNAAAVSFREILLDCCGSNHGMYQGANHDTNNPDTKATSVVASSSSSSSGDLLSTIDSPFNDMYFLGNRGSFASSANSAAYTVSTGNSVATANSFLSDVTSVLDTLLNKNHRGRSTLTSDRKCAHWIFSCGERFYGVKDNFPSERFSALPSYDLNSDELLERSLIRLIVLKKMPQNSGTCVIWTPSSSSFGASTRSSSSSASSTLINIAERKAEMVSSFATSTEILSPIASPFADSTRSNPSCSSSSSSSSSSSYLSSRSPFSPIATSVLEIAHSMDSERSNVVDVQTIEPSVTDFLRHFVDDCLPSREDTSVPLETSRRSSGSFSALSVSRTKIVTCLEQVLFLDVLLRRSEPRFAILVNGNPGTGKSTIMKYITRLVSRDSFTLLPTNVLREQVSSSLNAPESSDPFPACPSISLVRRQVVPPLATDATDGGETTTMASAIVGADDSNSDEHFVDSQPIVLTVSSFIKRALRYNLGPDVYSKIIQRYLDQQLERLRLTLRPLSMTRDLFPLERPVATVLYPPIMQVDEYNLCNYSEHFVIARACQQMCVSRIYYGDFAQSSPIRGVNDNAELIALFAPLTVQFLDNKRLLNLNVQTSDFTTTVDDEDDAVDGVGDAENRGENDSDNNDGDGSLVSTNTRTTPICRVNLHALLNDPVWNWKANNCDDGTNDYVRRLIARHVVHPIFASNVNRDRLLSSEVQIDIAELDRWYDSVAKLNDWFDAKPCRRYVADRATLHELIRDHYPTLRLPCFISRRNLDSDRINYWLSRAIENYVADRCARHRARYANSNEMVVGDNSRSFDKCFCLTVRRTALASGEALETSSNEIVHRTNVDSDFAGIAGDEENFEKKCDAPRNEISLFIDDDPWCADLTLIVGAVYRYIGPATKFMCSDSLLRLVAFLPDYHFEQDPTVVPSTTCASATSSTQRPSSSFSRAKKHERLGYRCNDRSCPLDCARSVSALKRKFHTLEKLSTDNAQRPSLATQSMTLGCGLPFLAHADVHISRYQPAYPRLLMQRLRTRDDVAPVTSSLPSSPSFAASRSSSTVEDVLSGHDSSAYNVVDSGDRGDVCNNDNSFVILSRSKYTLNRCNSKWTTNLYTNQRKREGMYLFGYPLVLNCGVSSWRVQGETIPTSQVFVDLKYMNKQQALVSLSRVRRSDQISKVLNLNLYAR